MSQREIANTESDGIIKWKDMELSWGRAERWASITEKIIRRIRETVAVRKQAVREVQSTIRGG